MITKFNKENSFKFSKIGSHSARYISFGLKLKIALSGVTMLIGVSFTVMGLFAFVIFASVADFKSIRFKKDSPVVSGVVTDIRPTNTTVNDVLVYEYFYEFTDKTGKKYTGSSFKQGSESITNVEIQYLEKNPEVSRIKNMSAGAVPLWTLMFILIFPFVGGIMAFVSLKKALMHIQIVQTGIVTFGRFDRMEATGAKINNQTVYRFFFHFIADDKNTYEAKGDTHRTHLLQDEEAEPLLYNPLNPNEAVMIDSLPAGVRKVLQPEIDLVKMNLMN